MDIVDKDVILAVLDESTGLVLSLVILFLFAKLARANRDDLVEIKIILNFIKDMMMSQDINPNKKNDPWGKGSRGTVMKVVPNLDADDEKIAKKAKAPVKAFAKWDKQHDKKVTPGSAKDVREDKIKAKQLAKKKPANKVVRNLDAMD